MEDIRCHGGPSFFQGRVSSDFEYNILGMTRCRSKKANAAPLKLSRMQGALRLLVLAKDLYVKSALTIASLRVSPHETDHAHRLCDVLVAGDVSEL